MTKHITPNEAAAALGRIGGRSKSPAKRKAAKKNGQAGGAPRRYTISPTRQGAGYALTGQDGKLVQEGYIWPTREAAMEAAVKLWPTHIWGTRVIRNGQAISIRPDSGE